MCNFHHLVSLTILCICSDSSPIDHIKLWCIWPDCWCANKFPGCGKWQSSCMSMLSLKLFTFLCNISHNSFLNFKFVCFHTDVNNGFLGWNTHCLRSSYYVGPANRLPTDTIMQLSTLKFMDSRLHLILNCLQTLDIRGSLWEVHCCTTQRRGTLG